MQCLTPSKNVLAVAERPHKETVFGEAVRNTTYGAHTLCLELLNGSQVVRQGWRRCVGNMVLRAVDGGLDELAGQKV